MKHLHQLRVRFNECDPNGHASNISYVTYLEVARIQFFTDIGHTIDPKGKNFVLATTTIDYLSQAKFNQLLTITTQIEKIGTKSFVIVNEILDAESEKPIARGKSVMVYFDFQRNQSEPLPDDLRSKLTEYLAEESGTYP